LDANGDGHISEVEKELPFLATADGTTGHTVAGLLNQLAAKGNSINLQGHD
jgi:hypothetical protein